MMTRYGLASVKARISIFWLMSTTIRVSVSSPPSRTSVATGNSLDASTGTPEPGAPAAPAPHGKPSRTAPTKTNGLAARTDIEFRALRTPPYPIKGGIVNHHLSAVHD